MAIVERQRPFTGSFFFKEKAAIKLSDEETGRYLGAVGNHEAKALTIVLMHPRRVYRPRELQQTLLELQGDKISWEIHNKTVYLYFINSFLPAEFVSISYERNQNRFFAFELTEYGRKLGVPLAGHLLDFSLRHKDHALQDFLGATNSSGEKHAPTTRLQILRELAGARGRKLREADIAKALGEEYGYIGTHLRSLNNHSVLTYEVPSPGEPISLYRFLPDTPKDDPKPYPRETWRMKEVTEIILDICRDRPHEFLTIQDVGRVFFERYPDSRKMNPLPFYYLVSAVLSYLSEQGYLTREKFHLDKHSEISTSEKQQEAIEDFVDLIDHFQSQESGFLKDGIEKGRELVRDPEKVSFLMRKAHEASPSANKRSQEESKEEILALLGDNRDMTNREIYETLREKGGHLGINRVQYYTRTLLEEGRIQKEEKNGGVYRFHQTAA